MINKQCGGVLSQMKTKVKAEGKKQVMKVLEKLPSKDDIKEQLISGACSIAAQNKMKKIYNKIHVLITKLENILLKPKPIRDGRLLFFSLLISILPSADISIKLVITSSALTSPS